MAHLELGVPIQPDMVFEIGSIAKQFTATAILMLQEHGQLSVDDEVTKYFYEDSDSRIHFRRDAQGKITGMDFLQHFGPDEIGAKTAEPFPAEPAERQAIQVDPGLYDAYVGVYELAPGFPLTLTREGDRLMAQPTGLPKAELFPESETKFFLKVEDTQIEFQRGPDGKATGLTLFQRGRQRRRQAVSDLEPSQARVVSKMKPITDPA